MALLFCYFSEGKIAEEVYIHARHSGKLVTHERYVITLTIAETLTKDMCSILPVLHALSE